MDGDAITKHGIEKGDRGNEGRMKPGLRPTIFRRDY